MDTPNKTLAWHFLRDDGKLNYPPHELVEPGSMLVVDKNKLAICLFGLHASKRLIDGLHYAPGALICRVELSGKIIVGEDKLCASQRKVLWMIDGTRLLHEFACKMAMDALLAERAAGREPDPRSFAAIEAKHKYLNKEITSEQLTAARSAARSAEESAARSAAESAAWSAAWSAERSAARSRQNKVLTQLVRAEARSLRKL